MPSSINFCIIGAFASGKTSLVTTFIKNKKHVNNESTIGASFIVNHTALHGGALIQLNIWDTAGQERYASLLPMYSRNADVVIFTIDAINAVESVNYIKHIAQRVIDAKNPPIAINLVVTKMDTQYDDTHAREMMAEVSAFIRSLYYQENIIVGEYYTSAMTYHNVDQSFIGNSDDVLRRKVEKLSRISSTVAATFNIQEKEEQNGADNCINIRRCY